MRNSAFYNPNSLLRGNNEDTKLFSFLKASVHLSTLSKASVVILAHRLHTTPENLVFLIETAKGGVWYGRK